MGPTVWPRASIRSSLPPVKRYNVAAEFTVAKNYPAGYKLLFTSVLVDTP